VIAPDGDALKWSIARNELAWLRAHARNQNRKRGNFHPKSVTGNPFRRSQKPIFSVTLYRQLRAQVRHPAKVTVSSYTGE
jgi:hypothetical protein